MRWFEPTANSSTIDRLARELSLPPTIARILALRGIEDPESAQRFLYPSLSQLHDPFLMAGMQAAVSRVRRAVEQGEKVLIYGDYDVDGTMAVVVLLTALRSLGAQVDAHIPDRMADGYGMRAEVIERAARDGYRLVLSVDTGIREHAVIARARELGVDCIVTDHHLPDGDLPAASAILNPHRADCAYPEKNLSGVGVAFKLAQALLGARLSDRQTQSYLKVVALGTIADVVPLVGENRVIAHFGLAGLREPVHQGLGALLDVAGVRGRAVTTGDVGFRLAPRLNAAGRMENARDVIDLFTCLDGGKAREIAERLDGLNRERQQVEEQILAEIAELIQEQPSAGCTRWKDRYSLVFARRGWHRGVIGIAAQRVAERYHRPTLVIAIEDESGEPLGYGSGRSISGFHLLNALTATKDVFVRFGGHAQAAGFTLPAGRIQDLESAFEAYARHALSPEDLEPEVRVDAEVALESLDWKFYQALKMLEPYGVGNPTPVFGARGLHLAAAPRVFKDRHLKLRVAGESKSFAAVAWGKAEEWSALRAGDEIDLAFTLEESTWDGLVGLELGVKDLRGGD
ncbi:MAG TPA: single-stranded-DNA-specific exonuclease RecJ [Terriglobia bacterium]|nr:single-stranded-DNA-specific exonuclease RecJ [Terriglobia bacterium]